MNNLKNISISIIIPTWNRKNILIDCIDSLLSQRFLPNNFEIIICDSYSTDGTEDKIKNYIESKKISNLKLYQCEFNNVSAKRNIGIKNAKFEHIVLIDDDCIPFKEYIENYLTHFRDIADNEIICGQYRTKKSQIVESNYVRYRDSRNFYFANIRSKLKKEELSFNRIVTGNLGFKKKLIIEKNILFNEKIIGYGCEDVDWAYRLIDSGFKILKTEIKVYHNETSLNLSNYKMKWFYMANGSMPLLIKYNYAAASKLPMFYLEQKPKNNMQKIKVFFTHILLNKYITSFLEYYLSITDRYKFFYNPFLFRCVLLGAYVEGVKRRQPETISEEETRKGWYAKGSK